MHTPPQPSPIPLGAVHLSITNQYGHCWVRGDFTLPTGKTDYKSGQSPSAVLRDIAQEYERWAFDEAKASLEGKLKQAEEEAKTKLTPAQALTEQLGSIEEDEEAPKPEPKLEQIGPTPPTQTEKELYDQFPNLTMMAAGFDPSEYGMGCE